MKVVIVFFVTIFLFFSQQINAQTELFSEDFSSCTGNNLLPQCNWVEISTTSQNRWYIASTGCNINGNSLSVANNSGTPVPCSFTDNKLTNIIAYRTTGSFTTLCHTNVTVSFNYKVGGSVNDYGMVVYCLNSPGTFANWVNITTGGDGSGRYYGTGTLNASTINLPAGAMNQSTVYIGFKWYNDNSNNSTLDQGFSVDDIVVTGTTPSGALPSCASGYSPVSGSTLGCGATTATLSWAAAACATSYKIYLDQSNPPTTLVSAQAGTSYTTGTLNPATTYFWKIVPANSNGDASSCTIQSFITPAAVIAPTAPDVTRCGPGSVTLTASGGTYPANYFWFDDIIGGNLLSMTNTYITPSLTSTRPYYVSDASLSAETSLNTGTTPSVTCITSVSNSAQLFNITNNRTFPVIITQLAVRTYYTTGSCNAQVFFRENSYTGNETSSLDWTQVFNGSVTRSAPTIIDISDFVIPPGGIYGIYVYFTGDPSTFISGSFNYSNSDIKISTGAIECQITAPFTLGAGSLYANYSMVGTVYYKNVNCMSSRTECEAIINDVTIPSVTITADPGNIICPSSSCAYTAEPVNGGISPTYNWYVGATLVGNGLSYTTSTLSNGDVVTCVLIPSGEMCPNPGTATSNAITMSVLPITTINTDPSSTTLCQNGNTSFTVVASSGPYQWQVNTGSGWTNITAAGTAPVYGGWNTAILMLNGVDDPNNGYQYRCLAGCTPSNIAVLTVNPVSDPVPGHAGSCTSPANITLSASGAGANEVYYWYTTVSGGSSSGLGSTFVTPSIGVTTTYYVTIFNTISGCESYPRTPVIATIYTNPAIITNPVNVTTNAGGTANFTANASGVSLSYQWQVNSGTGWNNITTAGSSPVYSGWTTSTLHLSGIVISNNGYQYRCVVTGICSFTATSAAAILTVSNIFTHQTTGALPGIHLGTCMVNTCGGTYYDNGGLSNPYSTNISNIYRTFCPNEPLKKVQATVSAIDIAYAGSNCNDILYVYSGPNIMGTLLWAGCGTTGTAIYNAAGAYNGGVFQSTHISGCLTFQFSSGTSNSGGAWDGWNIAFSCADFPSGPTGILNTDCINAEKICSDITASSTTFGPGIISDGCSSCMGSENYVEWYSFMMQTGGTIELAIVPNGVSDLDFAIYKASDCNNLGDPLRCSYATRIPNGKTGLMIGAGDDSEGASGDQWVNEIHAQTGEVYYLMVSEWDKPNPNQYTLDWTLTNGASFSCDYVDGTLPVSLLSFEAKCEVNRIDLEWVTASEKNNDYFTIEKSMDAVNWQKLVTIPGNGNSNTIIHYSAQDNAPYNGESYYRMKQTDFDGKSVTFNPISVLCNPEELNPQINYYPNPFKSELIVEIQNMNTDKAILVICDMIGRQVFYKAIDNNDSFEDKFTLNFLQFPSGVYIAKFTMDGYCNTQKIVKN